MKKTIVFCALFCVCTVFSQQDTVFKIKEIEIFDAKLKAFSLTNSITELNDTIIQKNPTSLTELLRNNSSIYFKENGKGMVSSVSFRGTSAQQTAVIWNGININSQLNGQTDFNTLNSFDFNSITIRAGGGSVIYGSGAIGGTIHLNSNLVFKNKFENTLRLNYGSFSTSGIHYKLNVATDKIAVNTAFSRNQSKNDYEYIGYDKKNENGQYENTSFNTTIGYRIDAKNTLKIASYFFNGERFFSGTIASPSKSKYLDFNTRNLLEWKFENKSVISTSQIANLSEEYKYFENKNSDNFSFGTVKTFLFKYDLLYKITNKIKVNPIVSHLQNTGEGSDILKTKRAITSFAVLLNYTVLKNVTYEASVRKEITSNYKSPLLYSVGLQFKPFLFYAVNANFSKNFRIPTYNDLYWQGSGNPDLKPESSLQFELNNIFQYKKIEVRVTAYSTQLKDMLRWVPNVSGIWKPENTDRVKIYGLETNLNWKKKFQKIIFAFNGNYAYTKSIDEKLEKQLIYVPYHKITSSVGITLNSFSCNYQYVFNGQVFTSSDNFYKLKEYGLSNVALNYVFKMKIESLLSFQIFNLENKPYQNMLSRPMPGRNYTLNLTLKF